MTDTPDSTSRKLVLASSSVRRQQLLREAGYSFEVESPDIDEDDYPEHMSPIELAMMLARAKAAKVAARHRDAVVLAADTVVSVGETIIGKPDDAAHAREIIRQLVGVTHVVITGLAVAIDQANYLKTARVLSAARLKYLSAVELERYLASGLWRGKAGAYGIQDSPSIVQKFAGCETNILGLPMTTARAMLAEAGIKV